MGIYSDILLTVDYDRTLTAPDSTIPSGIWRPSDILWKTAVLSP